MEFIKYKLHKMGYKVGVQPPKDDPPSMLGDIGSEFPDKQAKSIEAKRRMVER